MPKTTPRIRERLRYEAFQLGGSVCPANRRLAIRGRDARDERRDEDLEKSEWERGAYQIQHNETPAGAPNIPYHLH
jgi:hypothetical protein